MANWDVTGGAGGSLEFEATLGAYHTKPIAIDTNHFLSVWSGTGADGFAGIFTVNTTNWTISTASTPLEFDTQNLSYPTTTLIDATHAVVFWTDSATDGRCQTLAINGSTWVITTAASVLEYDTELSSFAATVKIDTNHLLTFWSDSSSDGRCQTFTVNTTTWSITTSAAALEFNTSFGSSFIPIVMDANHVFCSFSADSGPGVAQVFTINTTTWAVTTTISNFTHDTSTAFNSEYYNGSGYKIDTTHAVIFYYGGDQDGFAQVFTINTTTWAVATASDRLEFDTQYHGITLNQAVAQIDTNHFLHAWPGPDTGAGSAYDGFVQVFEVNTTTWAITTSAASFEFNTTQGKYPAISEIIAGTSGATTKFFLTYSGDADDGYATTLNVEVPSGATNYKTQINIGDVWKTVTGMQINIGDVWKTVTHAQINIGDVWKTIFSLVLGLTFWKK